MYTYRCILYTYSNIFPSNIVVEIFIYKWMKFLEKKKKTISKDQIFHKEEDKLHISL